jgi:hypothetical protein
MSNNKYLQIEFGTGNLFEFSKEKKEGFEEHISSKNTISYRKYHKEGVYGIYRGTSIRETDFGKEVSLLLVDKEGNNNYINMPLFDAKKNIAVYAESLICVLPALEENYVYRFFSYAMDKKDSQYKSYGVSIKHADMNDKSVREDYPLKRLSYTIISKDGTVKEGDIPAVKWESHFDGSKIKNAYDKNKYLHDVLVEYAKGALKMPVTTKVTGGEPPKPYGQTVEAKSAEQPKAEEKVVAYTQEFNEEKTQEANNSKSSAKSELPF